MNVYLLRHSEADYRLEKVHAEFPGVPLTTKGRKDAKIIAESLKNISFDEIICSDLLRAKQTIDPVKTHHSDIKYDSNLREIEEVIIGYSKINESKESTESQICRMESIISRLEQIKKVNNDNTNILLVTHFGVIEYISKKYNQYIKKPKYSSLHIIIV